MRKGTVLAIALLLVAAGCTQAQQKQEAAGKISFTLQLTDAEGRSSSQKIEIRSGASLFDAMQESGMQMEYKDYTFGKMMTSVGAVVPARGEYLAIYVNGKYAEKGAEGIVPASGDVIELRAEKIR